MAAQLNNIDDLITTDAAAFSARELSVLNEIATVVSSASDISDVYASFAALVADVIDWDGIIVNTPANEGRSYQIRVREGDIVPGRPPGTLFDTKGSLYGETVRTRKTQFFTADEGQTAELALRVPGLRDSLIAGFRSFMATPLFSLGDIVGAIHVQSTEPHAFTDHDRLILERIALFVGPAIGRFEAYESLKWEHVRSKSLLRIGRLLLGSSDLNHVLAQFVQELRTVVEIDRLTISVVEPDLSGVVDRYMYGIPVPGYEVNNFIPMTAMEPNGLDVNSHGYLIEEKVMESADSVSSPGLKANYDAGLRTALFAGLRSEGNLVGTINVKSVNGGAYGSAELEFFEHVADHVAASIARTLAHEIDNENSRIEEDRKRAQQEAQRTVDIIRAKQRLLTSASHELRTPLTGILAFVDLLARNRRGNLDDKQVRYLSIIRRNAEELSGKVNSIIDHAARDSGQLRLSPEDFDMALMLQEAVTDAMPELAEYGQSVEVNAEEVNVFGDRRQLLVAVGHLIDNASQYTPQGTSIQVIGELIGDNVEVSVIDQGKGVPLEFESEIFDPFERGELTGIAEKPGAGLGLSYVRAVSIAHGGDASYGKIEAGGAKFTICIPQQGDPGSDS